MEEIGAAIDVARLVDTATSLIEVPSPTLSAGAAADRLESILHKEGFDVERPVANWPESPAVVARLESVTPGRGESPLGVHLGQAISKGDRMDYAIQKAVELGVAAITPLYTEHGDVRLKGDRAVKKLAHWQAGAARACEQCGRATLPPVHAPMALADWLAERGADITIWNQQNTRGATPLDIAVGMHRGMNILSSKVTEDAIRQVMREAGVL